MQSELEDMKLTFMQRLKKKDLLHYSSSLIVSMSLTISTSTAATTTTTSLTYQQARNLSLKTKMVQTKRHCYLSLRRERNLFLLQHHQCLLVKLV
jgi:hypothetical protein